MNKIMVVDDDAVICDLVSILLTKAGFEVVTAQSGAQALNILKLSEKRDFGAVILDIMMPGMSGYEVIKEMQTLGLPDIPVMVLTAKAMDPSTLEFIGSEPNVKRLWKKPFELNEVLEGIYSVTAGFEGDPSESSQPEPDFWKQSA